MPFRQAGSSIVDLARKVRPAVSPVVLPVLWFSAGAFVGYDAFGRQGLPPGWGWSSIALTIAFVLPFWIASAMGEARTERRREAERLMQAEGERERERNERWLPGLSIPLEPAAVVAFRGELLLPEGDEFEQQFGGFANAVMDVAPARGTPSEVTRAVLASLLAGAAQLDEGDAARTELRAGTPYDQAVTIAVVALRLMDSLTRVQVGLRAGAPSWAVTFIHTDEGINASSPSEREPFAA